MPLLLCHYDLKLFDSHYAITPLSVISPNGLCHLEYGESTSVCSIASIAPVVSSSNHASSVLAD